MSRLLALDQASRISGWAFFNEGQLEAHGKFNATQEDIGERLFFIKNEVNKLRLQLGGLVKKYQLGGKTSPVYKDLEVSYLKTKALLNKPF